MFTVFYDFILCILSLLALPKLLWGLLRQGKYQKSFFARFGFGLPKLDPIENNPIFWIHAVSVGEAKAAAPLFQAMKKSHTNARFIISTTTETGQDEAKRSMPGAFHYFYLPFDFSWIIKKVVKKLCPSVVVLVESEFWYHLLKYAKKSGASVLLVNGKLSERSARRFSKLSFFSKKLFSQFDRLCLQSQNHCERFTHIGVEPEKLFVTGNLKLDQPPSQKSLSELDLLKQELGIEKEDRVIVVGSTHALEETWIISALQKVQKTVPKLKIILVPRHPERFDEVASCLKALDISVLRFSERVHKKGNESVILIDCMGLLTTCYQIAEVAVVGGSFIDKVGGHNVFEPVQYGVPTILGPSMYSQIELKDMVLSAHAAKQVSISDLPQVVLELLLKPEIHSKFRESALKLSREMHGCVHETFVKIEPFLKRTIEHK